MNSKAYSISPPLHPWFCSLSQSTNSCSDNETSLLVLIFIPSTAATVENAQQLPVKSSIRSFKLQHSIRNICKKKKITMFLFDLPQLP
ncbi:LOW QUALITY PROTEIN: hypothetical protein PanWU01x14_067500 [Parasponia andersonii]|uniref:Uncharacterized protein n=1 Tax=Parasponia andersonii TaxID=3476 RepID=A0A2P5DGE3_PARAD|nr:LOW QUALITY PROTEIN: hypothetical protein PanWU01x14_067500 [Parasponia andersonii]